MSESTNAPMRVASHADCEALYRLSGWNGQYWWYSYQEHADGSGNYFIVGEHEAPFTTSTIPAYDAAFLLGYLPAVTLRKRGNGDYFATWYGSKDYAALEGHSRTNPANALCRLAVNLFQAGILKGDKD